MSSKKFLSDPTLSYDRVRELAEKMKDPIRKSIERNLGYIINVVLPSIREERLAAGESKNDL